MAESTPAPQDRKPASGGERSGNRPRRRGGRGGSRNRPSSPQENKPRDPAPPAAAQPAAKPAGGTPQGGAPQSGGAQQAGNSGRGRQGDGRKPGSPRPQGGGQGSGQGGRSGANQEPARTRSRETEAELAPNLQDWSFEHAGYTAWMAHSIVQPAVNPERRVLSYIVDVHAGADAVNPRIWPAIQPFLKLEVVAKSPEHGARQLAELFRGNAREMGLPSADEYLKELPPVEETLSSPVQAALDTAMPLDMDHPQEDIDVMNEGRKGMRLRPRS